ncbi:MAG: zf-HC2 domain-containing protein [Gammaproteobacteria bacterium]|nr:zf-HC2 domain-containing protein [Gammaproteobacteria bacterium]MDH5593794.1 zf-HC2 domain-containing protein [Gammaproteobacteria bacterium]MDH5613520.1 zf-HC2 domain-containing protein [Gammaproteobacteria bacterium]
MMNKTEHPEDLLPWYVNGTLSSEEQSLVSAHLSSCDRCSQEVELLISIQKVANEPVDDAVLDMAQRRFMRELNSTSTVKKDKTWWQPVFAAAAMLVIVVQFVVIMNIEQETDSYQPAGIEQTGIVYQIQFHDGVKEQDIRILLQSANASIIDGPGALGLYRVRLDNKNSKDVLVSATHLIQHIEQE